MDTKKRAIPFLEKDWDQLYRDKSAGSDDLVDYDALSVEEKRFVAEIEAITERIPKDEQEKIEKKVEQFMQGTIGLAEFEGYPPELLYQIAKIGNSYVDLGKLKEAEAIFKGLALLDHNNYYYRGMLGAIYQRQRHYIDAITQYSLAIVMNPEDIPSYTNRGECWLKVGVHADALADFAKVLSLGEKKVDPWVNRARILHKNLKSMLEKPRKGKK